MTEMKTSYLAGFTALDYYAAVGAFRGSSLPAEVGLTGGFMASVLFRNLKPMFAVEEGGTLTSPQIIPICGNLQVDNPVGGTRGWALRILSAFPFQNFIFEFVFGDQDQNFTEVGLFQVTSGAAALRTMLVTVGIAQGPLTPGYFCAVNGQIVVFDSINSRYTPADLDNPFTLGGAPTENDAFAAAANIGIAGFAFKDAIASLISGAAIVALNEQILNQWADVMPAEDMVDSADFDAVFSTRRGLPDVESDWLASQGNVVLARQGTDNLFVQANKPRFWSGACDLPPLTPPEPPVPA